MECPICKNKICFAYGTCIECGYNYIDNTFRHIRVNTNILKSLLPEEIFNNLVEEHKRLESR